MRKMLELTQAPRFHLVNDKFKHGRGRLAKCEVVLESDVADGCLVGGRTLCEDLSRVLLFREFGNRLEVSVVAASSEIFDSTVESPLEAGGKHRHGTTDVPL